jgi:HK97 family phage portal protein
VRWLQRLFGIEQRAAQLTAEQIYARLDGLADMAKAGVYVSDKTALRVSTVLSCVRVISEGCATPELHVYRDNEDGRQQRATNIPEYRLLNRRPNEWQTSFEWRRMMTIHAALAGTAVSIKVRGNNRRVRELIPVEPGRWTLERNGRYDWVYRCYDEWGPIGTFAPEDVFTLHNVQWELIRRLDVVDLAREAIGLAIAAESSQARFHQQSLRPSGIYSVDGALSTEQYDRLVKHLDERSGVTNTGKPMVLDRGGKFSPTTMTGVDAQHIETRDHQVGEICRAFGVFPIMVGHADKTATFASSEAFFSAHLKHTLKPWHQAWTQRIDETLLDGAGPLYAGFDTRYLTAGAMKDRAQWARTMVEMGIYTRNELREEEGKDPLPGLDEPLTPLNMQAGAAGGTPDDKDDPDANPQTDPAA